MPVSNFIPDKALSLNYTWDVDTDDFGAGTGVLPFGPTGPFPDIDPSEYALLIRVDGTDATNTVDVEGSIDGTNWTSLLAAGLTAATAYDIDEPELRDLNRVKYPFLRITDDQNADPGDVVVTVFARRIRTLLNRY